MLNNTLFTTQREVYNLIEPPPRFLTPSLHQESLSLESLSLWGLDLECFSLTIFSSISGCV